MQASERQVTWGRFDLSAAVLIGTVFVLHFVKAIHLRFWFDEILTWAVVNWQPGVLDALRTGADGQPPLFYWLTKTLAVFSADPHVGLRLVSLLAIPVLLGAVYAVARNSAGPLAGRIAVCVVALTTGVYAADARPYAIQLAFVACAVLCWQKTKREPRQRGIWPVLLAASLAAVASLHFYGFLVLIPFAVAELASAWRVRRIDFPVWCAIAVPVLMPVLHLPIIQLQREMYSATIWARPKGLTLARSYVWVLPGSLWIVMFTAAALDTLTLRKKQPGSPALPANRPTFPEVALAGMLMLYPLVVYAFAVTANGGFTERYCWPTVVGAALAIGFAVALHFNKIAGLFTMGCLAVLAVADAFSGVDTRPFRPAFPFTLEAQQAGARLPLAVSGALDYLFFVQYSGAIPIRLVYVRDFEQAGHYVGHDTAERNLTALTRINPNLHVLDRAAFLAEHAEFLLHTSKEGDHWIERYLRDRGYRLTRLTSQKSQTLYRVQAGKAE